MIGDFSDVRIYFETPTFPIYLAFVFWVIEIGVISGFGMLEVTYISTAESIFAPSQWETALLCNDVFRWLGANLESALYVDGLVQDCSISSVLAMEILQSSPQPSIWHIWPLWRQRFDNKEFTRHSISWQWCYLSVVASDITVNWSVCFGANTKGSTTLLTLCAGNPTAIFHTKIQLWRYCIRDMTFTWYLTPMIAGESTVGIKYQRVRNCKLARNGEIW